MIRYGVFFFTIFFTAQVVLHAGKNLNEMSFAKKAQHLKQAAQEQNYDDMKLLLEAGAPSHIVFILLIKDPLIKIEIIKKFLDAIYECDLINSFKRGQLTLLMHAVCANRNDLIIELLARQANIEMQDDNGWTALHWAAAHCFYDCVRTLYVLGGDRQRADKKGRTPADVLYEKHPAHLLNNEQLAVRDRIAQLLLS